MPNYTLFNCCERNQAPRWDDFDGFLVAPCRTETLEDGVAYIEQCDAHEAEFWTVYGRLALTGPGVEALTDVSSPFLANLVASRMKELSGKPVLQYADWRA